MSPALAGSFFTISSTLGSPYCRSQIPHFIEGKAKVSWLRRRVRSLVQHWLCPQEFLLFPPLLPPFVFLHHSSIVLERWVSQWLVWSLSLGVSSGSVPTSCLILTGKLTILNFSSLFLPPIQFSFFWLYSMTCGILVPWPGIKATAPVIEVGSPTSGLPGESLELLFKYLWLWPSS